MILSYILGYLYNSKGFSSGYFHNTLFFSTRLLFKIYCYCYILSVNLLSVCFSKDINYKLMTKRTPYVYLWEIA